MSSTGGVFSIDSAKTVQPIQSRSQPHLTIYALDTANSYHFIMIIRKHRILQHLIPPVFFFIKVDFKWNQMTGAKPLCANVIKPGREFLRQWLNGWNALPTRVFGIERGFVAWPGGWESNPLPLSVPGMVPCFEVLYGLYILQFPHKTYYSFDIFVCVYIL